MLHRFKNRKSYFKKDKHDTFSNLILMENETVQENVQEESHDLKERLRAGLAEPETRSPTPVTPFPCSPTRGQPAVGMGPTPTEQYFYEKYDTCVFKVRVRLVGRGFWCSFWI